MLVLLASKGVIFIQQVLDLSTLVKLTRNAIFSAICQYFFRDLSLTLRFLCIKFHLFGKQTLISMIVLHSKL